jgi:hypothetical protein
MTISVAVADSEPEDRVGVEVYLGDGDRPNLQGLQMSFRGGINLTKDGLLVFAPTGDEVVLGEIGSGPHRIEIYRDSYPTSKLVVLVDPDD